MPFLAAGGAGFFAACRTLRVKQLKKEDAGRTTPKNDFATGFIWLSVAMVFLGPLMFVNWPAEIPFFVWPLIGIRTVFEIVGVVFYLKALQRLDASFASPIFSGSNILFVFLLSMLLNNEFPEFLNILGVAIIISGISLLGMREYQVKHVSKSSEKTETYSMTQLFGIPLTSVLKTKIIGILYLLGGTLSWSLCASFHKTILQATNVYWYVGIGTVILVFGFFLCNWYIGFHHLKSFSKKEVRDTGSLGILNALDFFLLVLAQSLTLNVFVNAIKHASMLFTTTLGGWLVFQETVKHRIPGICLIVVGIFFIAS